MEKEPGEPKATRPYMPGYGEYATKGKGPMPWSWAAERLTKAHTYFIATVSPDRRPHVMAVWGIWMDNAFFFCAGPRSRKVRNLAANPRCVVHIEPGEEPVIMEGTAEEVKDPERRARFIETYDLKYDWHNWDLENSQAIYMVHPTTAFGILENTNDDTESLTRWTFER